MRLLLLASSLDRGGAETHVCALAIGLAEQGHEVEVVSSGGALTEELQRHGIPHHRILWNTHNLLRLMLARRALRRLVTAGGYSLLHAHGRIPSFFATALMRRGGPPAVTTAHARFCAKGVRRRLSRWGTKTIAVSEDLKQYLCETYGVSSERIEVIANGVDSRRFCPDKNRNGQVDKLRFVFLSRLDEDCSLGARLLCKLAPALHERFPSLEVVLVGGGAMLSQLQREAQMANRLCRADVVSLTGHLARPEEVLAGAVGALAVSRAALEAMACGVPVILGGDEGFLGLMDKQELLPQAERTNFCCRGCAEMTEALLKQQIVHLLCLSSREREDIGRSARRWVIEHHSLKTMIDKTVAFYRSVERYDPRQRGSIVLCGYYGYGNVGDDTLLRASIQKAKARFAEQSLSALTCHGRRDEARFGIRCVRRSSLIALWRELKGAERLIYGGGTLLQDTTSLRSLLYYSSLLLLAQHKGVRTELWANGLEEPHSTLGRWMMRRALKGCERIGLRDDRSMRMAKELLDEFQSSAPIRQTDLALGTPPCEEARVRFLQEYYRLKDSPNGYFLVAVRGKEPKGYVGIFEEWLATLRGEGMLPLFVPMLPKEDTAASLRLCRALGGSVAYGLSASDIVGLAADSRVVCGMRLHALVFAASAGTPFVGFGGDPKLESFCRENGGVYFTDLYH